MSGYMVYWPQEQVRKLKKAGDTGPIRVILGSVHTKMPSIARVKAGDVIYPVTLEHGTLYVMARLPVEKVEPAFDYLLRETGRRQSALIPKGVLYEDALDDRKPIPHLCHQEPFNCCSETAASGTGGSAIQPRPIPKELIRELRFGPGRAKQRPLKLNARGELTTLSLSGSTRQMSEETKAYFDSLFD